MLNEGAVHNLSSLSDAELAQRKRDTEKELEQIKAELERREEKKKEAAREQFRKAAESFGMTAEELLGVKKKGQARRNTRRTQARGGAARKPDKSGIRSKDH